MKAYSVQIDADLIGYRKTKSEAQGLFKRSCEEADKSYDEQRPVVVLEKVEIATDQEGIFGMLNGTGGYILASTVIAEYTAKERND